MTVNRFMNFVVSICELCNNYGVVDRYKRLG